MLRSQEASAMIEEFSSICLLGRRVVFLWMAGVCAIFWVSWDERNSRVFRGVERNPREIWSLVCFPVSL